MSTPVPVVVVEDDRTYRQSLELLFEHTPGFTLAAAFEDAGDAIAAAGRGEAASWRLVMMDLELPRVDGIAGTRQLKAAAPHLAIVMLTVFEDAGMIVRAICAGADGYLLKKAAPAELIASCEDVLAGGSPLTSGVARTVLDVIRSRSPLPPRAEVGLSRREHEVLSKLVDGRGYKQVAAELDIGIDTVRTYIRSLYRKLQVHNVAEAVSRALREGLV
jgi:two-component system, NarL family, nitrate/nitrite response regulator NarL